MNEYIERERLLRRFNIDDMMNVNGTLISLEDARNTISNFPAADVAPVVRGWWEWFEEWSYSTPEHSAECDDCGWRCSECKTALEDMINGYYDDSCEVPQLNYCPKCGAKMDGGDNSATD